MDLKGTKTEKNLMEAFAGESQARNKYTYFASKAKKEGYEKEERKKKDKKQQKADNVYLKGQTSGFDIKV